MTLTADRFAEFYAACHGYDPFPWQSRFARRIAQGDWPEVVALPTAAGKTACIDAAVFALACGAEGAPRRIFFVVDRRIVVDQAYRHAEGLAEKLADAKAGILKEVASALRKVGGDSDRPLDVFALRGGMYRESAWARSPLQPTVIASTVDQVGSRLLFRGYGVSDGMAPVHAGLVGSDALILLDEAHVSRPFEQTLRRVQEYQKWTDEPLSKSLRFVAMTATPGADVPAEKIERDEAEDRGHPVLGKRIEAKKPATLVIADKAKGSKGAGELVKALKEHAEKLAAYPDYGSVGVIVNRVLTARELAKALGDDAVLLTGRMRPLDRDRLFDEKLRPLLSNAHGKPPKYVIGTQCLEVGADFDFPALVTECASLDALRQRFGRLNRVARRDHCKAVVVIRGDQTEDTSDDPVYGASLANTWKWLNENATAGAFDFGVAHVREKTAGLDLAPLNSPAKEAPVLFPAHLDCWVQTHPKPSRDPDPAVFLHGPQAGPPDVQVVFREDLPDGKPELWPDIVALCPPSSSEAVPVPIAAFKKWLGNARERDDSGDEEGAPVEEGDPEPSNRKALLWAGPDDSDVVTDPKEVRPSKVYVVPTTAPDLARLGDFPYGATDYAETAFLRSRDKVVVRLPALSLDRNADDFEEVLTEKVLERALELELDKSLEKARPGLWEKVQAQLSMPRRRESVSYPERGGAGWVVTTRSRLKQFDPEFLDDQASSRSPTGRQVELEEHSLGVATLARDYAAAVGLDGELYYAVGLWHDLGKLDRRFQAMLRGTSPRTAAGMPLAKSGRAPESKKERDAARAVHKYPSGARHELLSVALMATQTDDDLPLFLTQTHHGSARPFASPVAGKEEAAEAPFRATLFGHTYELPTASQDVASWNAELVERFWRVVRRYGWWGAAYRETVFRLADHEQSRREQERERPEMPEYAPPVALKPRGPLLRRYELPLEGLDGANPLGFLAAVGALRVATEMMPETRLRWRLEGAWRPSLDFSEPVTQEQFVEKLHKRVHRVADASAIELTDERHKVYRREVKKVVAAADAIKKRNLRGNERQAAFAAEVEPLRAQESVARRAWLEALEGSVASPFLCLGKSISASVQEFRSYARRAAERLDEQGKAGRVDSDFVSAFACEACQDRNGRVIPTDFQLITGSGHQFFLDTLGQLMGGISSHQLHRALFDPWTYADARLSFRWDPVDDRRYALGWADPSDTVVRAEHGANLLAAFALPLFPLVPTLWGARTTGFACVKDRMWFNWPVWEAAITEDAVRTLVRLDFADKSVRRSARAWGVRMAFASERIEVGGGMNTKLNMTPAVPV